jgi:uncharacterized protein involved in exopolysaccharide biosynthesis
MPSTNEAVPEVATCGSRPTSPAGRRGDNVVGTEDTRQARERIARLLRLLWDQRRFIAGSTLVGVVFGVVLALVITPEFRSSARLMPPQLQQGTMDSMVGAMLGKAGGTLGSIATAQLNQQDDGELVIGMLRSRTILDRMITRFDLVKIYKVSEWTKARKALTDNTTIFLDKRSGMITIDVDDRSAERAAALAKDYTEELNRVLSELSNTSASKERAFLEQRLAMVKADLQNAERNLGQFSSKSATYDLKDQGKAVMDAAALLQGQLIAAEAELEGLKPIYGDDNVRIRSLQARTSELKASLHKIGGKAGVVLADNGTEIAPPLRSLPLLGATYTDLYRQARVEEAIYEALKQRYEIARLEEAKQIPNVKVLDIPDVPSRKAFPPRKLVVLMSGIVGFAFAIFWLLGRAAWEQVDADDPLKGLIIDLVRSLPGMRARSGLQANAGLGDI